MSVRCDVAIIGGGPVGAALAIVLAGDHMRVALIEGRLPPQPCDAAWDARVYALSPGNRQVLRSLNVWPNIAAERIEPIVGMQVWGDDGRSRIEFDALEAGGEDLGCIVESDRLQLALWDAALGAPGVTAYCPARCESLHLEGDAPALTLMDATRIDAQLIVGADGADSWLRGAAGLSQHIRPYGQTAVVANFTTARPHGGVARQWFHVDGVLAWLPLPGDRISMVWSVATTMAEQLLVLDAEALCERAAAAGERALGRMTLMGKPGAFSLRLVAVPQAVKAGVALVGDAAHVVHPLAGQGINLGFRDVVMLAQVLRERGRHEAAGELAVLRRYERARREDWLATKWVTDGLQRLFAGQKPPLPTLRNWGLAMTDRLPGLKRRFMAHAMQ
jgi:2-octaprenylphenol hydroxylase